MVSNIYKPVMLKGFRIFGAGMSFTGIVCRENVPVSWRFTEYMLSHSTNTGSCSLYKSI